jgi:hypothetical protein
MDSFEVAPRLFSIAIRLVLGSTQCRAAFVPTMTSIYNTFGQARIPQM